MKHTNYDLVVIGAGPAGMSAAIQAAMNGAKVAIIDENPIPGGKLLGQLYKDPKSNEWWIGKDIAKMMDEKIKQLPITCFQESEVWGIFPHWKVNLNTGEELSTKNILLATGAAEKAIPIPGWTKPGAMAIGAAQTLANYHRVKPGNKVAIIGIDPLSLTVAHELKLAGIHVIGIFQPPASKFSHEKSNPKQTISYLSTLAHLAPNPWLKGFAKMAKQPFIQTLSTHLPFGINVQGVPLYFRKTILEIEGEQQVEQIKIANLSPNGSIKRTANKTIKVDCVCISGGLYPLTELATLVGCKMAYMKELGGHIPLHNAEMETTEKGIFVAGNITGIESAKVAIAQGKLAGTAISGRMGLLKNVKPAIQKAQKQLRLTRNDSLFHFHPQIEQGRKKVQQLWDQNFPAKEESDQWKQQMP
ncbi:NAD(P)/FAD-dependent oxidoreductase [Ornithinibacillus caprae]|nr:NAD(P)/FAD-dependent oxidoreductase [Ornithinibacillus caprae]